MTELPVVSWTGATQVTDKKYEVTGVLDPDATGSYVESGDYNGKRYYQRTPNDWVLWWDGTTAWFISEFLGGVTSGYWVRTDPNIQGAYIPQGSATGTATVTKI